MQRTPNVPVRNGGLTSVSCASPAACTAAGSYGTSTGKSLTLAERWNGTSWRIQATPVPAGSADSELLAVSCSSPDACTAAGTYAGRAGKYLTLAERWNGTSWRIQATPNPASSIGTGFAGVSCSSARACTAAGTSTAPSSLFQPLAQAWNGTRWLPQATVSPRGAAINNDLYAVSCTSPRACTAAGLYVNLAKVTLPLAERWNGTRWRIQPAPSPAGALSTEFNGGVSCSPAGGCTAVGDYGTEAWNGTSWHFQPIAKPAGAQFATLSGVSCTVKTACTAVGSYISSTGFGPFTLAENGTAPAEPFSPPPTPSAVTATNSMPSHAPRRTPAPPPATTSARPDRQRSPRPGTAPGGVFRPPLSLPRPAPPAATSPGSRARPRAPAPPSATDWASMGPS